MQIFGLTNYHSLCCKKASEVSRLRSKTLRLSSFYWLQFGKSPPCFPGLAPGVKSPILAAVTILLSSNTWAGRQTVPTQKQIFCGWDQVSEYIFWSVQVSFWYFGPNDLYPPYSYPQQYEEWRRIPFTMIFLVLVRKIMCQLIPCSFFNLCITLLENNFLLALPFSTYPAELHWHFPTATPFLCTANNFLRLILWFVVHLKHSSSALSDGTQ